MNTKTPQPMHTLNRRGWCLVAVVGLCLPVSCNPDLPVEHCMMKSGKETSAEKRRRIDAAHASSVALGSASAAAASSASAPASAGQKRASTCLPLVCAQGLPKGLSRSFYTSHPYYRKAADHVVLSSLLSTIEEGTAELTAEASRTPDTLRQMEEATAQLVVLCQKHPAWAVEERTREGVKKLQHALCRLLQLMKPTYNPSAAVPSSTQQAQESVVVTLVHALSVFLRLDEAFAQQVYQSDRLKQLWRDFEVRDAQIARGQDVSSLRLPRGADEAEETVWEALKSLLQGQQLSESSWYILARIIFSYCDTDSQQALYGGPTAYPHRLPGKATEAVANTLVVFCKKEKAYRDAISSLFLKSFVTNSGKSFFLFDHPSLVRNLIVHRGIFPECEDLEHTLLKNLEDADYKGDRGLDILRNHARLVWAFLQPRRTAWNLALFRAFPHQSFQDGLYYDVSTSYISVCHTCGGQFPASSLHYPPEPLEVHCAIMPLCRAFCQVEPSLIPDVLRMMMESIMPDFPGSFEVAENRRFSIAASVFEVAAELVQQAKKGETPLDPDLHENIQTGLRTFLESGYAHSEDARKLLNEAQQVLNECVVEEGAAEEKG